MKPFWKSVTAEETSEGWRVLLDAKPVSTPGRRPVVVPLPAMASAIAEEWAAQTERVDPLTMPMTRTACTCLDRVEPAVDEVRGIIAAYGETDLLCYRADRPDRLIARQQAGWDPVLDWAEDRLGARLRVGEGVMHVEQAEASIAALKAEVDRLGPWTLTAMADLTQISGSLVLALAVLHARLDPATAWSLSRIDEEWNIEEWGEDAEAAALAARHEADFLHSGRVLALLRKGPV